MEGWTPDERNALCAGFRVHVLNCRRTIRSEGHGRRHFREPRGCREVMTRVPFVVLIAMVGCSSALAQNGADAIDEVVVVGRMPGPPLWKVSSGDHALWIFPHIVIVPKEMRWESGRVERLIAGAQEYLPMPVAVSTAAIGLTPIKLARTYALYRESTRLPDGQTLADVLPPPLYERFGTVKARYLPRNDGIEELVPQEAGEAIGERGLRR